MGNELKRGAGRYWVLFFQPLPEAGERIAVALVFEDAPGRVRLEYEPTFAKVGKVYPDTDVQGLAFYLDSLRTDLNATHETEAVLNSYGPQLAASTPRKIAVPVSQRAIEMLMDRYLYPGKRKPKKSEQRDDKVAKEIEAFVRSEVGVLAGARTGVSPRDILGRHIAGAKKVALAIPDDSGWTLVDGVDLNQMTPQKAVERADEISRTFWNYNRAASETDVKIRRVGVVLNGTSHLAAKTHEAHDYALHRFEVDSDLAIDAAYSESGRRLRELLEHA